MALAPQQFCVRWNSYHTNLQAVFPRLLTTEHFADVTLACENRQLRCHKLVLSACSAYFERLLVQNPCKHPIVFMKDMRFSEMQSLVDFMYKGEVNVTQDELPSLLKSAEALQIRGLCSSDASGLSSEATQKGTSADNRDYTVATEALLAHAQLNRDADATSNATQSTARPATNGPGKKRKSEECEGGGAGASAPRRPHAPLHDVKEETVEEDGLYYGELDQDDIEYNDQDEETGKAGSSLSQPSAQTFIRVKPESKLFLQQQRQSSKTDTDYITRLSKMNAYEIQHEFEKYGFTTSLNSDDAQQNKNPETRKQMEDNDYYKSWLEQNGELEVSLLRASDKLKKKNMQIPKVAHGKSEVELIPKIKTKSLLEKTLRNDFTATIEHKLKSKMADLEPKLPINIMKGNIILPPVRRRGRPPIFRDKNMDIGESVLKADLDQFLEGKEISSSGLSRKDLERVMMGKFNPNRRYSNEAMWAALMDVKKGGSIYRAAQTHKVPRKSLRNWMKRCHIKSSFPMPQQLKQFVENNKKQKDVFKKFVGYPNLDFDSQCFAAHKNGAESNLELGAGSLETEFDIGKHFLTFTSSNTVSSEDESGVSAKEKDFENSKSVAKPKDDLPETTEVVNTDDDPNTDIGKEDGVDILNMATRE